MDTVSTSTGSMTDDTRVAVVPKSPALLFL